jgi:hypothetical protein
MMPCGGLSNHPLKDLLHCLTPEKTRQDPPRAKKPTADWPDGRRKFGTVSGAILKILAESGTEMSVKAIRAEAEALLGGRVSRFSVADYLLTRANGPRPLVTRTRHGHYRLIRR